MQKVYHKRRTLFCSAFLALMVICCGSCGPEPEDYNLYDNMRDYAQQKFTGSGAVPRTDMPAEFAGEYIATLKGIVALAFSARKLEVHLYSYESPSIAAGSISQFEVPPDSENFTDCAFVVRPAANIRAPFLHGDALKGMSGMSTSFSMDFYNVDNASISVDGFFGDQTEKLEEGLALVEQYQRTGADRGEYTRHLDPYKSRYRIEIEEPDTDDPADKEAYAEAALAAYKLFMDAYFESLAQLAPEDDAALIQGVKDGTDAFINLLYEEDTAVKLGKMLFGDDIDDYFMNGFWRSGYYGEGL